MKKEKSPCVNKCVLNKQQYCTGCKRSLWEIMRWSVLSKNKKQEIIQKLQSRNIKK